MSQNQKQKQGKKPQPNDSPKGGSTLFSKGTKSVAAESEFGNAKERDKDGKPVAEKKQK